MGGRFSRAPKSEDKDKLLYDLFGSLLLLQAMCDLRPIVKANTPDADVHLILLRLIKKLPLAPDEDGSLKAWRAASEVVKKKLVPLLQKFDTTHSLQSFLPEQGQSWKRSFETKLKVSETVLAHLISFVGKCVKSEVQGEFKFLASQVLKAEELDGIAQEVERYVPCAVACAWSNENNNDLALRDHLLPRFYLLQALCDQLPILTSTSEDSAQKKMSREISICFALLLDAAERPYDVSEVVDRFLVPYLQLQPELAKSLRDYLPKSRQSWIDFLHNRLDGLKKDVSKPNVQHELLNACKSLVGEFRSEYLSPVVDKIHHDFKYTFDVPEDHTEVNVFYATDRIATEDGEYVGGHSAVLHYGVMTVGIPHVKGLFSKKPSENDGTKAMSMPTDDDGASTSVGIRAEGEISRMESPESNDGLKHVEILSVDTTLQADRVKFVEEIQKILAQACTHNPLQLSVSLMEESDEFKQEVLLYIHGYNVTHEDAIMRAAQLKYDLDFKGLVMVYSWPSKGTLWDYRHDEEMIEKSAEYLPGFIETILTEVHDNTKVHILAYNMGNRALIRAFCKSAKGKGQQQNMFEVDVKGTLKNVIFLAPDAKKTEFEKMDLDQKPSTCVFTIYSSATDLNLLLSKTFHEETQLVNTPNRVEEYARQHRMPIDVIDITEADINMSLHHSYLHFHHDFTALEDIIHLLGLQSPVGTPRNFHLKQKNSEKPRLFGFTKDDTSISK
ncbi:unnamed protein product [Sphagnum jensenii]|uniref:Uncharacterized protein n=1 Tax=Sphagnum jensenii TaxID=128206 RepID=A0ABP1BSS9_9BRYO